MKIIKVNDTVCLRDPNPEVIHRSMLVRDVSDSTGKVFCSWISDEGKLETGLFSSGSLKKINLNRNKPIEKI